MPTGAGYNKLYSQETTDLEPELAIACRYMHTHTNVIINSMVSCKLAIYSALTVTSVTTAGLQFALIIFKNMLVI